MVVHKIFQNNTHQEGSTEICEQMYRTSEKEGLEKIDTGDVVLYITPYYKITKSGTVYADKGFPVGEILQTLRTKPFHTNQALYLVDRPGIKKTLVDKIKGWLR